MGRVGRGFRLIDLMAAIAVLALLMAVLIPFIQSSRETARRSQCVARLNMLGLALHKYNATHGCLPPAGESCNGIGGAAGLQNFSIKAHLLPYMELVSVYNTINFMVDSQSSNSTARGTKILGFLCPSDVDEINFGPNPPWATNSYIENRGTGRHYNNGDASGIASYPGCDPHLNKPVQFASIKDGLSQTAAFSEFVKGRGRMNEDGLHMVYTGNVAAFAYNQPDGDYQTAQQCQRSSSFCWDSKGEHWMVGDSGRGGGYFHIQSPNRKACAGPGGFDSVIGASSYHPGGVNMLLMDGAVKFVKNDIAFSTWHALGTINGGEVVPTDWRY